MKFEIGQLAIINENATSGLPNRVGELVEVVSTLQSPNYDYIVELDNGDFVPVKEKELNHLSMPELDLITYIKRDNKVLYAPLEEEVVIHKIDMIHGHVEVQFLDNNAMGVVGIESLRPIDQKEEVEVSDKFKVGDKVKMNTQDHYNGVTGVIEDVLVNKEYNYRVRHSSGSATFMEEELELLTEEQNEKELHFDLLFGHFENEDGTFTVPKQLLHNLLNKIL